jgi:hypothetical protein
MQNTHYLTIGAVANHFGCQSWQVRRLFERGHLPPALRVGAYRVIPVADLHLVEDALREAGYLATRQDQLGPNKGNSQKCADTDDLRGGGGSVRKAAVVHGLE